MIQQPFTPLLPAEKRKDLYFLLAILLWLLLPSPLRQLAIPDEGRYADVARWMMVSGDWLIPRENGLPFFHKPPLLYWMDAGLFSVFGPQAWVARLPSVMAGMVLCGGTFWFTRRRVGSALARFSTLILATSMLVFGGSQYVNHDMLVAAGIALAILCFADGLLTGRTAPIIVAYVACAGALMSKGLIGIALPGLVLLPWLILTGRWRQLGHLLNPFGIGLFFLLATPWFVLVQQKFPGFFHYFFIEQQFQRYTTGGFNNKQAWWFYIAILLVLFLPWPLLLPRVSLWKNWNEKLGRELTLLMLCWVVAVVGFFSIPQSKLIGYVLPATPAIAILLASALQGQRFGRLKQFSGPALIAVLGIILLFAIKRAGINSADDRLIVTAACAMLVVMAAVLALLQLRKNRPDVLLNSVFVAVTWALVVIVVVAFGDGKNNARDSAVKQWLEPGTELVFYRHFWYDLPFILNRTQTTAVVNDWRGVKDDSGAREQKDGAQFDAAAAKRLWEENDFRQALTSGKRLLILTMPNVRPAELGMMEPVYRGRNFNAYLINDASRKPSSGSAETSAPPPAPAQ